MLPVTPSGTRDKGDPLSPSSLSDKGLGNPTHVCENLGEIEHVFAVPCRKLQRELQLRMVPRQVEEVPARDVKIFKLQVRCRDFASTRELWGHTTRVEHSFNLFLRNAASNAYSFAGLNFPA